MLALELGLDTIVHNKDQSFDNDTNDNIKCLLGAIHKVRPFTTYSLGRPPLPLVRTYLMDGTSLKMTLPYYLLQVLEGPLVTLLQAVLFQDGGDVLEVVPGLVWIARPAGSRSGSGKAALRLLPVLEQRNKVVLVHPFPSYSAQFPDPSMFEFDTIKGPWPDPISGLNLK